jgi:hypothetical protein
MAKIFLILFSITTLFSNALAQVSVVTVDIDGDFVVTVEIRDDAFVTVNSVGEIIDAEIDGNYNYYEDRAGDGYRAGKISSIGSVSFRYYEDRAGDDYRAGKLSSGNRFFSNNGIKFRVVGGN